MARCHYDNLLSYTDVTFLGVFNTPFNNNNDADTDVDADNDTDTDNDNDIDNNNLIN